MLSETDLEVGLGVLVCVCVCVCVWEGEHNCMWFVSNKCFVDSDVAENTFKILGS